MVEATVSFQDMSIDFAETLGELIDRTRAGALAAVAIDMPIGLLDRHPRPADVMARRELGPRRSSVFPTPLRVTLDATDYADACVRSRAVSGKALSKQAFHLLAKIRELDQLIEPEDQDRVVEAHPELAFARLAGAPLVHSKSTPDGRSERLALLDGALGLDVDESLRTSRPAGLPITDVLDAMANLTTAARLAAGDAELLGDDVDVTGKRCAIAF